MNTTTSTLPMPPAGTTVLASDAANASSTTPGWPTFQPPSEQADMGTQFLSTFDTPVASTSTANSKTMSVTKPTILRCDDLGSLKAQDLKATCPLPVLMKRMGLGAYAKKCCKSPLRQDDNPSFGVYQKGGRYFWKDHGNNDGGD